MMSVWAHTIRSGTWAVAVIVPVMLAYAPGIARDRLAGPVPARVVSVIDGDMIEVRARVWLGHEVRTRVRLAGIDAPELTGKCAHERALAVRARDFLSAKLAPEPEEPAEVVLRDIRHGKFAGRVLARVETAGGEDLGRGLLAAGLARRYDGRTRAAWCDRAEAPEADG